MKHENRMLETKEIMLMSPDEIRSHRLNNLLRSYLNNPNEAELYGKALSIGVTVNTARWYVRLVIIQAGKTKKLE